MIFKTYMLENLDLFAQHVSAILRAPGGEPDPCQSSYVLSWVKPRHAWLPRPKHSVRWIPETAGFSNHPSLCTNWAQLPYQKELLLPAEVTKAKLHQVCTEFLR